jgi:hypothetical protein
LAFGDGFASFDANILVVEIEVNYFKFSLPANAIKSPINKNDDLNLEVILPENSQDPQKY